MMMTLLEDLNVTDWRGKRVHKFKYHLTNLYAIMWQTQEHAGRIWRRTTLQADYSEKLCPVIKLKLFTDYVPFLFCSSSSICYA